MRTQYNTVIILSAQLSTLSKNANTIRHDNLLKTLSGWSMVYAETLGVYKGQGEESVLIVPKTSIQVERLKKLAFETYGQESILVQDNEGISFLEFHNGSTVKLGRLTPITQDEAMKLDAYTILNKQYWTTK
jgi:hypothetical protein